MEARQQLSRIICAAAQAAEDPGIISEIVKNQTAEGSWAQRKTAPHRRRKKFRGSVICLFLGRVTSSFLVLEVALLCSLQELERDRLRLALLLGAVLVSWSPLKGE